MHVRYQLKCIEKRTNNNIFFVNKERNNCKIWKERDRKTDNKSDYETMKVYNMTKLMLMGQRLRTRTKKAVTPRVNK